jgi:hypothetical protein
VRIPYCILAALTLTANAWAQTPVQLPAPVVNVPTAGSGTGQLPPLHFFGTVAGDELFSLIKADARYSKLDQELIGSPILLRVTNSFEMSNGGRATGLASAIFAGGSLGLLPLVTNGDQVITYELVVNSTPLTTFTYRKNFTRSTNIWAKDTTYGLGKDGLAWAKGTVALFLADAASDEKLAALLAEYDQYFPGSR